MKSIRTGGALCLAAMLASAPVVAQAEAASTAVDPDPASVAMPDLAFTATPLDEADYDKYFYFHRAETAFAAALADLRDCDAFASGLTSGIAYQQAPYPYTYTMAGAAGGVIANVMVAAIFGSAEKRRLRRVNMRRCMGYKGYGRYGLSKDLWQKFNFEEGFSGEEQATRNAMLAQQAKVASGPVPAGKELGL